MTDTIDLGLVPLWFTKTTPRIGIFLVVGLGLLIFGGMPLTHFGDFTLGHPIFMRISGTLFLLIIAPMSLPSGGMGFQWLKSPLCWL